MVEKPASYKATHLTLSIVCNRQIHCSVIKQILFVIKHKIVMYSKKRREAQDITYDTVRFIALSTKS